jgi:hypothetical protein
VRVREGAENRKSSREEEEWGGGRPSGGVDSLNPLNVTSRGPRGKNGHDTSRDDVGTYEGYLHGPWRYRHVS